MAKGNMFQGMARGKVGDVVFSRLDGQQISRVRNRNPRNPRTNKQLYQRAIMATVMQAYSAGKEIFDHAFQGLPVGSKNQQRFMSLNNKALRALLANDLNTLSVGENAVGRFVGPGTNSPVGFAGMVISEGKYDQRFFGENADSITTPAAASADETVAQYAERLGLIADDLYTFVGFTADNTTVIFSVDGAADAYGKHFAGKFFALRLRVKPNLPAETTAVTGKTLGDLFDVDFDLNSADLAATVTASVIGAGITEVSVITAVAGAASPLGTFGIIRSREDSDLRSSSSLRQVATAQYAYGLSSDVVLQAWKQGAVDVGDSDLILEGGDEV